MFIVFWEICKFIIASYFWPFGKTQYGKIGGSLEIYISVEDIRRGLGGSGGHFCINLYFDISGNNTYTCSCGH